MFRTLSNHSVSLKFVREHLPTDVSAPAPIGVNLALPTSIQPLGAIYTRSSVSYDVNRITPSHFFCLFLVPAMLSWAALFHILVGAVLWGSVPNLAIPLSESSQSLQSSISLPSSALSSLASSGSVSLTGTPSSSIASVSTTPTPSSQPSTDPSALADIQTVAERRKSFIVAGATAVTIVGPVGAGNISAWCDFCL